MSKEIQKKSDKDRRYCPKCETRMEAKGVINYNEEDSSWDEYLYQCPTCKNIEIV